jgi:hypothetical protein
LQIIDAAIAAAEKLGKQGLALGLFYEARARIAGLMGDLPAFEQFAERCAAAYTKARNPLLGAKVARLIEEARQQELGPIDPIGEADQLIATQTQVEYETIYSRMQECVDMSDRARVALTLLLQTLESFNGYLFAMSEDGISLLAGLPETMPEDEMFAWARGWLEAELNSEADVTATIEYDEEDGEHGGAGSGPIARFIDQDGRTYEPLPLVAHQNGQAQVAALLVFHLSAGPRTLPDKKLVSEIAEQLIEHAETS